MSDSDRLAKRNIEVQMLRHEITRLKGEALHYKAMWETAEDNVEWGVTVIAQDRDRHLTALREIVPMLDNLLFTLPGKQRSSRQARAFVKEIKGIATEAIKEGENDNTS